MRERHTLWHSSRHNSGRSHARKQILTIAYGLTLSLALTLIAFLPSIPHMGTSFIGLDNLGDQVVFLRRHSANSLVEFDQPNAVSCQAITCSRHYMVFSVG